MRARGPLHHLLSASLRSAGRLTDRLRGAVVRDGHTLDPQVRAMLAAVRLRPALNTLDPIAARRHLRREAARFDVPLEPCPTRDISLPGRDGPIPARLYQPEGHHIPGGGSGLVYLHGGGFVIGDLEVYDRVLRRFANRAGATVISVDYRLAPEHPFPAAVHDALDAWQAVWDRAAVFGLSRARLGVGGDSAGGLLSAVVAQRARVERPPASQMLVYPGTDLTCALPSHDSVGDAFLLTRELVAWFVDHYDPPSRSDPLASPLFGDVAGVCPAHLLLSGFDPLRDEGQAYADRLTAAGVPVDLAILPGQVHGWLHGLGVLDRARRAWDDLALRVGLTLARGVSPEGSAR